MKGDIILILQTEKIIREYNKQLNSNKLHNLDEMNKFLQRQKLPKLTQ